jgi:hypothetical protein
MLPQVEALLLELAADAPPAALSYGYGHHHLIVLL